MFRELRLRALAGVCAAVFSVAAGALSHAPDPLFHDGYEGIAAGPTTDGDAARFLAQATFGPTDVDIAHLRAVGYQGWLNEQFGAAPTYEMDYINWVAGLGEQVGQNNRVEAWFLGALGGPDPQNNALIHSDQLRQRVAFALSEILVISDQNTELGLNGARGMAYYYDILINNAFGNYRTLLEKVTLSPAMGVYLNMIGNRRADSSQNVHPDENYAREINQLFSIGLVLLNSNGTPKTGQPATYDQNTITSFAQVLTGWNWASCDTSGYDQFVGCYTPYNAANDYITPMVAYETRPPLESGNPADYNYHDNGTHPDDAHNKQLLDYGQAGNGVLADGGTAAGDLAFALDNIYNHPNVAPFISKQLIQRLVTSNPTPAYVQRVAKVFDDNRASGTQLRSVVQAILLDPEARNIGNIGTSGKLREPLLTLTHLWRAMGAQHACGQDVSGNFYNNAYRYAGYITAWSTGNTQYQGIAQAPQDAFTVFNFFKPSFLPSGEMSSAGLLGPEFQLQTDSVIALTTNTLRGIFISYDLNNPCDANFFPFGEVMIDHAQDYALAGNVTADALVDAYNHRFMSGQMSPFMRQTLLDYLNVIDAGWGADWKNQRIDRALYLILTSPEYMVQK
jgi:hypothetical protein